MKILVTRKQLNISILFLDFKLQNHNFSVTFTTEFLLEICFMAAASKKTMKNSNF